MANMCSIKIGDHVIIPDLSRQHGMDPYTVLTVEKGIKQDVFYDRTVAVVRGKGKTLTGNNYKNLAMHTSLEELNELLELGHVQKIESVESW